MKEGKHHWPGGNLRRGLSNLQRPLNAYCNTLDESKLECLILQNAHLINKFIELEFQMHSEAIQLFVKESVNIHVSLSSKNLFKIQKVKNPDFCRGFNYACWLTINEKPAIVDEIIKIRNAFYGVNYESIEEGGLYRDLSSFLDSNMIMKVLLKWGEDFLVYLQDNVHCLKSFLCGMKDSHKKLDILFSSSEGDKKIEWIVANIYYIEGAIFTKAQIFELLKSSKWESLLTLIFDEPLRIYEWKDRGYSSSSIVKTLLKKDGELILNKPLKDNVIPSKHMKNKPRYNGISSR